MDPDSEKKGLALKNVQKFLYDANTLKGALSGFVFHVIYSHECFISFCIIIENAVINSQCVFKEQEAWTVSLLYYSIPVSGFKNSFLLNHIQKSKGGKKSYMDSNKRQKGTILTCYDEILDYIYS